MSFDPDAPAPPGSLYGLPFTAANAKIVVVPVPWEATTSYRRGTAAGPANLVEASVQVDLFDVEYGEFWRAGIALAEEDPEIARWNTEAEPDALRVIETGGGAPESAARVNALSERVNTSVYQSVCRILDQGKLPALIGGDHSCPFGAIRAVAQRHPGVGVLHIDAHADLRVAYEGFTWSHASILYNVSKCIDDVSRVVQVGIRDVGAAEVAMIRESEGRICTFFDADLAQTLASGGTWAACAREIVESLPEDVYISFDVDGMDPSLCPTTGTPVPGGLSFRDVTVLLRELSRSRRIVGFDLNEIGPGEWDGNVAARVFYKLCGAALTSQR